jgi:hypothetical protein
VVVGVSAYIFWHAKRTSRLTAIIELEKHHATVVKQPVNETWMDSFVRGAFIGERAVVSVQIAPDRDRVRNLIRNSSDTTRQFAEIEIYELSIPTVPTTASAPGDAAAQVAALAEFPWLGSIDLWFVNVSDQSIQLLRHNHRLEWLNLASTNISDEALRYASQWKELRQIKLNDTRITGKALASLVSCGKLEFLDLAKTDLRDDDLECITRFRNLRRLRIENTAIGDAALRHIGQSPSIESLNVAGTRVSDVGIQWLKDTTTLKHLYLNNTQVTDAAVAQLLQMGFLRTLSVAGSRITPLGVDRLKNGLPKTRVMMNPPSAAEEELELSPDAGTGVPLRGGGPRSLRDGPPVPPSFQPRQGRNTGG